MLARLFGRKAETLSVVIVTQNCADQLELAIASIVSVADEIVVVDGGSTDHTEEVAKSFDKVRYFQSRFRSDIADQKNFAIEQATSSWVFVLDSDEIMGDDFRSGVRSWISSWWTAYYELPRYWVLSLDPLLHVVSGRIYPDYQLRLFRNTPFWRYRLRTNKKGQEKGRVHHRFPKKGRGRGKKLDVHIHHFDFVYNDRGEREEKVRRYDAMEPHDGTTHRLFYLFEDYPFTKEDVDRPLPEDVLARVDCVASRQSRSR